MVKLCIIGAGGRMGKAITRCVQAQAVPGLALSGALDRAQCPDVGADVGMVAGGVAAGVTIGSDLKAAIEGADAVIDFSQPTGMTETAQQLAANNIAWVIGTTGLGKDEQAAVDAASQKIPVVMAPNMSLGVNLLLQLVEEAASALRGRGYDIEIVERHHRRKKDSPSGTALGLGQAAARGMEWSLDDVAQHGRSGVVPGDRPTEEIGFHAVRGGDFIGDHTVIFAAEGESVELSHRATSRDTFAVGALQAAQWVAGREPGLYTMRDVLGLQE